MRPHVADKLDPLDVAALPPPRGMQLAYRTQPVPASLERSMTIYHLIVISLCSFGLVVGLRAVAGMLRPPEVFAAFTRIYWVFGYPVAAIIAFITYLWKREASTALVWLVFPILAYGLVFFTTLTFIPWLAYLVLFVPAALIGLWLGEQIAWHYALWMIAHPLLELDTRRTWHKRWASRRTFNWRDPRAHLASTGFLRWQRTIPEDAEPRSFALMALFTVLAVFVAMLAMWAVRGHEFLRFHAGLFAVLTLLAILFWTWHAWNRLLQPVRMSGREVASVCWGALSSWLNYNRHQTPAPGVFRSPSGSQRQRFWLLAGGIFCLSWAVLPLADYFPLVLILRGPEAWFERLDPSSRPAEHPPSAPTLEEVRNSLDETQKLYLRYLNSDAERQAYLQPLVDAVAREREAAYARKRSIAMHQALSGQPGQWVRVALEKTFDFEPVFTAAVVVSVLCSLAVPPLMLFGILFFVAGRFLAVTYRALEKQGAYEQVPDGNPWDIRAERLLTSPAIVPHNGQQIREADHLWLGTSVENDYPILLNRGLLRDHGHIMGSTGSGKSAMGLAPLLAQMIRRKDASVLVLDLKGDMALFTGAKEEAERAGLEFRWLTTMLGDSTFVFNPFLQAHHERLTTYQRTELLMGALGLLYARVYGRDYYSDIQSHFLYKALLRHPDCASFAELFEILGDRSLYRGFAGKARYDAGHINMIVHRLASFPMLNATAANGCPAAVVDRSIHMADLFVRPQVVYLFLPAMVASVAVTEIARLGLYSLLTAAVSARRPRTPVCLVIDEFQRLVAKNLDIVLQQARDNDIGVLLANQTLADLKTVDGDLTEVVRGNTHVKMTFSALDVFHQDMLIRGSGEAMYEMINRSTTLLQPQTIQTCETIGTRLWRNDVLNFSSHPQRCLVQFDRRAGFTQFGGMCFVMNTPFHITEREYRRRRDSAWPSPTSGTVPVEEGIPSPEDRPAAHVAASAGAAPDMRDEDAILEEFLDRMREDEDIASAAASETETPPMEKAGRRPRRSRRREDNSDAP